MVDLTTTYLGLHLSNPIIAAASPLSKKVDSVRKMEDAGIGAVVMYSLFEEQINHESLALDHYLNLGTESYAEALTYFPDMPKYNIGPDSYLELIQKIKTAVSIPVIGSLNGISSGGWLNYARKIEQAGADALELNIYYIPTENDLTCSELEESYIDLVTDVRKEVHIPLAVKLSPYFTSMPNFTQSLVTAGADGLVLFNRFLQPELDIETLEVVPTHTLSQSRDLMLPLRWTAILYGRLKTDISVTGGVHTPEDVIKSMMAGAKSVQIASELLDKGIGRCTEMVKGIVNWMDKYEYTSIQQMIGSMSQISVAEPAAFERANYMKSLTSYDNRLIL